MNITKFGAFVNILPGRDGLVHISKLGKGKRINRVEDVLDLGDEIKVRVDDIDPNGKVSLTPIGDDFEGDGAGGAVGDASGRARRASEPGDLATRPSCRSRTPSTPRPARSSATSARTRRRTVGEPVAARGGERRGRGGDRGRGGPRRRR